MKEIFEYLKQNCFDDTSFAYASLNKIQFRFSSFYIIAEFAELDYDIYGDFTNLNEVNFDMLAKENINRIYILNGEILLACDEDENDEERYEDRNAYTFNMYTLSKILNSNFSKCVSDFVVGEFQYDNCGYCDELYIDGFQIDIDKKYWSNIKFFKFLLEEIDNHIKYLELPDFYDVRYNLKDNFELKTLNSNTKIRRLGYLKILLKMLDEQTKIPVPQMNVKFEKYCQNYEDYRKAHKNTKGNVIITKTGNSANPYIELALSLGLIHKAAGIYQIGKTGKVYNVLKSKIDNTNENPFEFSQFDTAFFLDLLLKEDFWFLYAILEQAAITPNIAYKTLKKDFKQILLKQISQFIDEAQNSNSKKVLPLKLIERRINEWKKPEVYMEHVLMPRLNWLYDMEFIELKNDLSFILTATGEKLLYNLSVWNDIALHKLVSPIAYIDNYFMKMINFVFDFQKERWTQNTDRAFEEYIENSFVLFKTLAPNRVTFSLCSNYTKQMLFWNNEGIVDTENIKKVFEGKQISGYIYKYQEHYKDGYIQKNK
jgi:hypothetical protein